MKTLLALPTFFFLCAGCTGNPPGTDSPAGAQPASAASVEAPGASIYAAAVANDKRPAADRESDAGRKPAAVLEFFGVRPGDTVLEMWATGGYYSELLSHVVGATGKVYVHQNETSIYFGGEEYTRRFADNRLPNTEILIAANNELSLPPDRFDAVTMTLNYHDFYWVTEKHDWEPVDAAALLAEFYKGLKPGGILGIVDHRAAPGSPIETGNSLHRIDPAIVIAQVEDAGFVLEAESDILANPDDDHSKSVFDASVRGKTDRFVLRFRKPR